MPDIFLPLPRVMADEIAALFRQLDPVAAQGSHYKPFLHQLAGARLKAFYQRLRRQGHRHDFSRV